LHSRSIAQTYPAQGRGTQIVNAPRSVLN
jgi:hypothetical protein